MKLSTLETILRELESADVRYLVAGGAAVNAYGYQRLTQDLDVVPRLDTENVSRALRVLGGLGYRPVVPVALEEFADPAKRRELTEHRNMQVFSLASDLHPDIDIFAREPLDFEAEYATAEVRVMAVSAETGWEAATWEGSRRAQIRRALRLSVRERLEGLEALTEVSARLAQSAPPAQPDTHSHPDDETPPAAAEPRSS